jgi:hypothetical protein
MPELPDYMLQKERKPDPEFSPEEELYRRVRPEDWNDEEIELDTIEFPDMSVTRQKYGPPHAARWERGDYVGWGVIGFQVKGIPAEIRFQGAFIYRMRPAHVPHRRNYPHAEVQVFEASWEQPEQETHIDKKAMPGVPLEAQQEWRELLRRRCRMVLHPGSEEEESLA